LPEELRGRDGKTMTEPPLSVVPGGGGPTPAPAAVPAPKDTKPPYIRKIRLNPAFAALIQLERLLDRKIWIILQHGEDEDDPWDDVSGIVYAGFRDQKSEIIPKEKVGLLIHSAGGHASAAYQIVRLFQRRTRDFVTLVPLWAKSAATLISVGGFPLHMGAEAELGPLDVQMYDTIETNGIRL
jgi:hypothetical protein